ncbi:MAG: integrase core domain-containing protein [Veillonellales bacterium]
MPGARRGKGSNPFSLVDFTCPAYIELLEKAGVKISMDGKGRCRDNARTERFFRSLKYERLYLNEYDTPRQLRAMINEYIQSYNTTRPHSSLNWPTPVLCYPFYDDQKVKKRGA